MDFEVGLVVEERPILRRQARVEHPGRVAPDEFSVLHKHPIRHFSRGHGDGLPKFHVMNIMGPIVDLPVEIFAIEGQVADPKVLDVIPVDECLLDLETGVPGFVFPKRSDEESQGAPGIADRMFHGAVIIGHAGIPGGAGGLVLTTGQVSAIGRQASGTHSEGSKESRDDGFHAFGIDKGR